MSRFSVKHKQIILAALVIIGFIAGLFSLVFVFSPEPKTEAEIQQIPQNKKIETAGSRVKVDDVWRYRQEEDNKKLSEKVDELKAFFEESQTEKTDNKQVQLEALEQKIAFLEQSLVQQEQQRFNVENQQNYIAPEIQNIQNPEMAASIQKITLNLAPKAEITANKLKTIDNTIPAGAFAKSILLSGVDASTAMSSASDPRPMLLRLVDPGTLPRQFHSDLENCHATASAYGDLSSERVYARLEKLTCVDRLSKEIIETQIAGYIAGPDGKSGIRGRVVSRDAQLLARGFVSGIFSGLSNIASPQNRQDLVNPFSAGNPKIDQPSTGNLFKSGVAEGGSSALDKMAKYYIDRAEQLQPVIQVGAGITVDIVFTEGVCIGSSNVQKDISAKRNEYQQGNQTMENRSS
jgi:conjugal transfer pilus assembly protein TraB